MKTQRMLENNTRERNLHRNMVYLTAFPIVEVKHRELRSAIGDGALHVEARISFIERESEKNHSFPRHNPFPTNLLDLRRNETNNQQVHAYDRLHRVASAITLWMWMFIWEQFRKPRD